MVHNNPLTIDTSPRIHNGVARPSTSHCLSFVQFRLNDRSSALLCSTGASSRSRVKFFAPPGVTISSVVTNHVESTAISANHTRMGRTSRQQANRAGGSQRSAVSTRQAARRANDVDRGPPRARSAFLKTQNSELRTRVTPRPSEIPWDARRARRLWQVWFWQVSF